MMRPSRVRRNLSFPRARGAQGCNLGCQTIFFDDAARPHTRHQRVFADDGSVRFDQRYQHVEGAPAELDGPAVGEHLAAVWQHLPAKARLVQ
jgi:hypothetical protein